MEEKTLYFTSIDVKLKNINFDKKDDIPDEYQNGIDIVIKDTYGIDKVEKNYFTLDFDRYVGLNPEYLFAINVKFECKYILNNKSIKEFENKKEELEETIRMKMEKLLKMTSVVGRASSLISTITNQIGLNPIITPPSIQNQK